MSAGVGSKYYSGFNPLDIGNCALWLDAADTASFTMSGANLATWNDKSGSGYVCSPVSGNSITRSTQNGQNVFYFNNTRAQIPSFVWTNESTIFLVTRTAGAFLYSHWTTTYTNFAFTGNDDLFYVGSAVDYRDSVNAVGTPVQPINTWGLFGIGYNPSTTSVTNYAVNGTTRSVTLRNGTPPGAGTTTATLFINGNGSVAVAQSFVAEILHYNRSLSEAERQQIEGYLAWKWSLRPLLRNNIQPTSIPGCALWLDAADSSTITLSGSSVTQWRDKSGNGRNTSTLFRAPTFSNGSVRFNNQGLSVNLSASTNVESGFFVAGFTNYNQQNTLIGAATGSGGRQFRVGTNTAIQTLRQDVAGVLFSGAAVPAATTVLVEYVNNGSLLIHYLNGGTYASGTAAAYTAGLTSTIGQRFGDFASEALVGYINEIIIYNAALTDSERQQVEGYLLQKWGIPPVTQLSTTHPYYSIIPVTRPFAPIDIPGCMLWLDAADPSTVTLSGSNVTQWSDKSGNGYNAIQNTAGRYPVYSNSAINGLSVIQTSSAGTTLFVSNFSVILPVTLILVSKKTGTGGFNSAFIELGSNINNVSGFMLYPGNVHFIVERQGSVQQIIFETTTSGGSVASYNALNTTYVYGANLNPAIRANGFSAPTAYAANTGNPSGTVTAQLNIGSRAQTSLFGDVQYGEFIVYNGNLTTFQLQELEGYLARKWGLQGSLPTLTVFDPLQISGCQLWLDAADTTTITFSSGSNVSQWNDKSGNSRNTASVFGTPILSNNSVLSRRGVYFNGSSYLTGPFSYSSTTLTWFVVATVESDGESFGRVLSFGTPGTFDFDSALRINALSREGTTNELVVYRNLGYIGRGMNITYATPFVVSDVLNGTSNFPFLNGTAATSAASSGNFGFTTYGISGSVGTNIQRNKGFIFEVIVYTSALTSTDRQQIEGYLARKWGLAGNLPATHPFASIPLPVAHPFISRLPRTVSFNPRQISNCALWLDAADSSTISLSGSSITQWVDKVSNVTFTTQGTAANLTLSNAINGNQSLYFNNSASEAVYMSGTFSNLTTGTAFYAFRAAAQRTVDWRPFITWFSAAQYPAYGYLGGTTVNTVGPYTTYASPNGTPTQVLTPGSNYVISYNWSGTTTGITTNGSTLQTGSQQPYSSSTTTCWIGADGPSGGSRTTLFYGEILMYNRTLTSTERQQVEGYLAWKWGLTGGYVPSLTTFNPTQISGCRLWLDAADTTTVDVSGTSVTQWRDKSGNGHNAIQNVTGRYPVYSNAVVNGLSVIQTSSAGTTLFVPSFTATLPVTVILVSRKTGTGGLNAALIEWGADVNSNPGLFLSPINFDFLGERSSTAWQQFFDSASGRQTATYNAVNTTYMYMANLTPALRVNGSAISTSYSVNTGSPTGSVTAQLNIGSRNQTSLYADMQYCELMVYNGNLSTTDMQNIEGYLALKWGLQDSLPSTHPYASRGLPSTHPYRKISPI